MIRNFNFTALAAVLALPLVSGAAQAAYPERPITFIVPFTAGGITDLVARTAAQRLEKELGQTIVVENRPGAGGSIGVESTLRTKPDGYTIFLGTQGTQITNQLIYESAKYDGEKDFIAVHGLTALPNVVVVNSKKPYKTLKDVVDYAKLNPKALSNSSAGTGSGTHLAAALFQSVADVQFTHVPYKGSASAITDLIGGQVDLSFDYLVSTRGAIKEGRLIPIAVTSSERSPNLPEVPSMTELGYPKATSVSWMGMFVRTGTPKDIVDRLAAAMEHVVADAIVEKTYAEFGGMTLKKSGAEFSSFVREEAVKWGSVVKALGLGKQVEEKK